MKGKKREPKAKRAAGGKPVMRHVRTGSADSYSYERPRRGGKGY